MVLELYLTEYFLGKTKKELYTEYENDKLKFIMFLFMRLLLSSTFGIIAGILAWRCNSTEPRLLRIVYTILAVLFSNIYIFFYLVYRIILKHPCKKA